MPTKYKDYPIYRYDEPAVYSDFSGGINTDPSNDHLLDNEIKDATNFTYLSGALVKRKGAKKLCDISCEDDLETIQGVFLFTYRITYIILAADGKLYQGIYNEDAPIILKRLYIYKTKNTTGFVHNEEDVFAGLEEKYPSELNEIYKHDGYIQTYFKDRNTDERYIKNDRGDFSDIISGAVEIGDVFVDKTRLVAQYYLCIKSFDKVYEFPNLSNKWESLGSTYSYTDSNDVTHELDATEVTDEEMEQAAFYNIFKFDIGDIRTWNVDDICLYKGTFYRCKTSHKNLYSALKDTSLFVNISDLSSTTLQEESYLVFQNYRDIGFATLNNKLYIATGTRIIEVYLDTDELRAKPVSPYLCNYTEITKIGYNYMSPYPELAVASQKNTVTTSMSAIKVQKTVGGKFLLTPVMNIQIGDSVNNYYYRWEKLINGVWYVVVPFISQDGNIANHHGATDVIEKKPDYQLEVDDADVYQYRCTFAKEFEEKIDTVNEWDATKSYSVGEYVSVGAKVYKCIHSHTPALTRYATGEFQMSANLGVGTFSEGELIEVAWDSTVTQLWAEAKNVEMLPFIFKALNENNEQQEILSYTNDYVINKSTGGYFGSATSVLFNNDLAIDDTFLLIHSCTAVIADGQKLLFYSDKYNSGQWFKTIINNPGYITDRGCLSFKTNKNESVVGVVPFQGNLIVFANSDDAGGSIHLVQGNGDDYDDSSGYYSPYRRKTINASISCNNAKTIQVCDNILVFKYFNRVYYINASDLNNEVVKVTSCNNRLLNPSTETIIPWDDNDVVSEVTDTYYALLWKEKYTQDSDGELVLEHPGLRLKMYYKMSVQYGDNSYGMPWLKDESQVFNTRHILYIKGRPIYLYHNVLLTFSEEYYKDIDKSYDCKLHLKGEGLNYKEEWKLIDKVVISYHRNQFNKVDLDVIIKNEAGHTLIDEDSKRKSLNDLGSLFVGIKNEGQSVRVGSTIRDDKLINAINMFPCLLADAYITARTEGSFTFSSITYSYETTEMPDTNPYDTYANIIRVKEIK